MFRRFATLTSAVLVTSIAVAAYAKLQELDADSVVNVEGSAIGMTIPGSTKDFTFADTGDSYKFEVDVHTIDTGLGVRNEHLRKYFPNKKAILEVPKDAISLPADKETKEGNTTGKFTLNGKSKGKQKFSYHVKRTGSDYHVQGLMTISLQDYGLKLCKFGDTLCANDEVKVKVKFKLRDQ
ncbi:MAG TPA: YceI family protein [Polyangiaceae bacterium]|jgi:polyisoprenoid-binding protein YceI|nr:YceI family protein [Polyangiaceae bacterium]